MVKIPDYDLGTARGRIQITSDTAGVEKAAAEMAVLDGEVKALQSDMEKQGRSSDDLQRKHEAFATRMRETTNAVEDRKNKERELADILIRSNATTSEKNKLEAEASKARTHENREIKDLMAAVKLLNGEYGRSVSYLKQGEEGHTTLAGAMGVSKKSADDLVRSLENLAKQTLSSTEKQHGLTQRQYEAREAANKLKDAEEDYGRVLLNTASSLEDIQTAQNAVNNAKREAEKASSAAIAAERAFRGEAEKSTHAVRGLRSEIESFNKAVGQITQVDNFRQSLSRLVGIMETVRTVSLATLAGGGALGGAGLLGSGGAEAVTALAGSMVQLIGVVGLLPGILAGAGASIGTLVVGLHGIPEALGSMGNVQEFVKAIHQLSPVAREALVTIQSFYSSFRGAMNVVQDSMIAPIINDIKPLIYTYLPLLMNSGKEIGNVFGQAGHLFAAWLETPATMQTIQQFMHSVAEGLTAALPAVQAFSNAFLTISAVGGGFFKQIGDSFAHAGQEFDQFISKSAQNGSLQNFIQMGINAFQILFTNIEKVSEALFNIFNIGNSYGGGFLAMFKNIGQEFLNWTNSLKGQNQINSFFSTMLEAGHALRPILHEIGSSIATVASVAAHLGINVSPGLTSFFHSLAEALKTLGPSVIASAPAINLFFESLGKLLTAVVGAIGPALPQFLMNFAQAATNAIGPLTLLATSIAKVLEKLTPAEITAILGFVTAFRLAGPVIGTLASVLILLTNPLGLVLVAVGLVAVALIQAYQNSDTFKRAIDGIYDSIIKLPEKLSGIGDEIGRFFSNLVNDAGSWGEKVIRSFASGLINPGLGLVSSAASQIASVLHDFLHQKSPARTGPLSEDGGSQGWGIKAGSGFATGMSSSTGQVAAASGQVAAAAVGGLGSIESQASQAGFNTGMAGGAGGSGSVTSAGITYSGGRPSNTGGSAGVNGGGGGGGRSSAPGNSDTFGPNQGMTEHWKRIVGNLSAWSGIFNSLIQTGVKIAGDSVKGLDIFARTWNGGVNPLTAPGGIDQGAKPFIPQISLPGTASVPGVPQVGMFGGYKAGSAGTGNVLGPPNPSSAVPASAGPVGNVSGVDPDQQSNIQMIIAGGRARGMSDAQIHAALAIASDESHIRSLGTNFSGGNASVGGVGGVYQQSPGWHPGGSQHDINTFLDTYKKNLDAQPGADPLHVAVGVQQHGSPGAVTPWQGTAGDNWYLGQVQNAMRNNPEFGSAIATLGGGVGNRNTSGPMGELSGARANPASNASKVTLGGSTTDAVNAAKGRGISLPPIYPPGTGGAGGYGKSGGLPDWAVQLGAKFGLVPSTYSNAGGLHAAGYAMDFAPADPNDPNAATNMDAFSQFIQDNLMSQTLELIHSTGSGQPGSKWWGIAGGKDVTGQQGGPGSIGYYGLGREGYPAHADGMPGAHVHWATDQAPILPGINAPGGPFQGPATPVNGGSRKGIFAGGSTSSGGGFNDLSPLAIGGGIGALGAIGAVTRGGWNKWTGRLTDAEGRLATEFPGGRYFGNIPPDSQLADSTGSSGLRSLSDAHLRSIARGNLNLRFGQILQPPAGSTPTGAGGAGASGDWSLVDEGANIARPASPVIPGGTAGIRAPGTLTGNLGGALGRTLGGAGAALSVAAIPGAVQSLPSGLQAAGTAAGIGIPGLGAVAGLSAGGFGLSAATGGVGLGVAALMGASTAFGSATGQEGPSGLNAGPVAPGTTGSSGLDRLALGLIQQRGALGGVSPQTGDPIPVNIQQQGGQAVGPPHPPPGALGTNQLQGQPTTGIQGTGPTTPQNQGPFSNQGGSATVTPGTAPTPAGDASGAQPGIGNSAGHTGSMADVPSGQAATSSVNALGIASASISGVGNIASSVFQSIDSIFQDVGAASDIVNQAQNLHNTEGVVQMVKDVQTFIGTVATIAQTVSTVSGTIGSIIGSFSGIASAGGDFGGEAGSAISAVAGGFSVASAIAGVVSDAASVVNAGVSIGIQTYEQAMKFAANVAGFTLGGGNTGWLGGNVGMLLDTNTGQVFTYDQNNARNKNTLDLPRGFWPNSQRTNAAQGTQYNQLNLYTGPGTNPDHIMTSTMWMVKTSPQTISVAGHK